MLNSRTKFALIALILGLVVCMAYRCFGADQVDQGVETAQIVDSNNADEVFSNDNDDLSFEEMNEGDDMVDGE